MQYQTICGGLPVSFRSKFSWKVHLPQCFNTWHDLNQKLVSSEQSCDAPFKVHSGFKPLLSSEFTSKDLQQATSAHLGMVILNLGWNECNIILNSIPIIIGFKYRPNTNNIWFKNIRRIQMQTYLVWKYHPVFEKLQIIRCSNIFCINNYSLASV